MLRPTLPVPRFRRIHVYDMLLLMRIGTVAGVLLTAFLAQSNPITSAEVAKLIEQELAAARVPGAAIVVVAGDDTTAGSYGMADVERSTAMTPLTLVHVGSLTKLLTALAVTAALEQRAIALQTPVGQFMPGLTSRAAAATFHHLLSHTAGLRDRAGDTGSDDELALASSARALGAEDFLMPPSVVFSYSNLGYALAGATLESLTKVGFAEALRDSALRPLGMERSTVRPSEALARPHALGHRLKGSATETIRTPSNDTRIWPAGYLWTNAIDMSHAVTALMNQGRVPGHAGLPRTVIERVTQAHTPMPNIFVDGHYGYGLMSTRDRGVVIYEHGGTLPGFSSILRVAPERRLGVAILTNLDNAPLRRIAQNVMAQALDLPAPTSNTRSERPVTAEEMKPFLGRYVNRGTAELAARDGSVVLILDDAPPFAVTRIGEDRFLARPKPDVPGPEFVFRPATRESPAYVHLALWAYVRQ